jgi:hypothetical protein
MLNCGAQSGSEEESKNRVDLHDEMFLEESALKAGVRRVEDESCARETGTAVSSTS